MANTNPLWKQLLGAVVGSAVAVVLYLGYQSTEPLRAYLIPPGYQKATASSAMSGTGVRLATTQLIDREHRLNDRAERVASRLREYRENGMVAVVPSGKSSVSSSSWEASSEASMEMATSSERHRLLPARPEMWRDQWSSEAMWAGEAVWQSSSSSVAPMVAASIRSSAAKYANPDALPSSGAAMMIAMIAGIGGIVGLGAQRWRRGTLRA